MSIKKTLSITAVSLLMSLLLVMPILTGCQGEAPATPAAEKTLKIGIAMPFTGPMSMIGTVWTQGLELGFNKVNEKGGLKIAGDIYMVKLFTEDSKTTPDGSTTAAIKLVNEQGVKFLVADIFDFDTPAFNKVTSEAGVLLVRPYGELSAALGGNWDVGPGNPLCIRLHPCDDEMTLPPIEYLAKTYPNVKTVALLNIDFPGWEVIEPYCTSLLEKVGLKASGPMIKFPLDAVDFYPIVTPMLQNEPGAIYVLHGTLDQFALIIKTARDLGFTGPIIHSSPYDAGIAARAVANLTNVFGNGIAMDAPNLPDSVKEVIELGRAKYSTAFVSDSLSAYDVAMLLAQLLEKAQSIDPKTVQDKFETLTAPGSLQSIFGPAYVGGLKTTGVNRVIVRPIPMCRFVDGKADYVGAYKIDVP